MAAGGYRVEPDRLRTGGRGLPPNLALPCDDPSDLGPRGRVSVAKVFWLRELPTERTDELFNAMHSYWLSHDYRVLSDQREQGGPALFVENNADAFRMSLQTNVRGELTISATSPCVWPDGTPPPEISGRSTIFGR